MDDLAVSLAPVTDAAHLDKADAALILIACAAAVGVYVFIRMLRAYHQQENDHWELYRDDPWD